MKGFQVVCPAHLFPNTPRIISKFLFCSVAGSYEDVPRAHMKMFRIAINKLSGWLFSRLLTSHARDTGSIPGRDMSILGPQD
jgi:hypothetical protein